MSNCSWGHLCLLWTQFSTSVRWIGLNDPVIEIYTTQGNTIITNMFNYFNKDSVEISHVLLEELPDDGNTVETAENSLFSYLWEKKCLFVK